MEFISGFIRYAFNVLITRYVPHKCAARSKIEMFILRQILSSSLNRLWVAVLAIKPPFDVMSLNYFLSVLHMKSHSVDHLYGQPFVRNSHVLISAQHKSASGYI